MAEEQGSMSYEEYKKLIAARNASQLPLKAKTAEEIERDRRASNQSVAEGFAQDLGWKTRMDAEGNAVVQDKTPAKVPPIQTTK